VSLRCCPARTAALDSPGLGEPCPYDGQQPLAQAVLFRLGRLGGASGEPGERLRPPAYGTRLRCIPDEWRTARWAQAPRLGQGAELDASPEAKSEGPPPGGQIVKNKAKKLLGINYISKKQSQNKANTRPKWRVFEVRCFESKPFRISEGILAPKSKSR
jgi:hypothetical protein